MANVVVDDQLLLAALRGREPADLRPPGTQLWTTGLWLHRLCRAATASPVRGALSRSMGNTNDQLTDDVASALTMLPPEIGTVALRHLAWPMAKLIEDGVRLNLLSLEALAAAETLGATICLAPEDENPPLIEAARNRGVDLRLVAVAN